MRHLLTICFLGFAGVVAAGGRPPRIEPSTVKAEVARDGARAVIDRYITTPTWGDIYAGIASGDAEWFAVAEQLKPAVDAGSSEELDSALFASLPKAPLVVIPRLMKFYNATAAEICTDTFEAELPEGGIQGHLKRIERGLKRAKTADEKAVASECRKGLAETRRLARANGLIK